MTTFEIADQRVLTRPHTPVAGCALDPCVEEASWIAWRLKSASPNQIINENSVQAANSVFDRILEMAWLPGRMVALSEVATSFDDGYPKLTVHLALAVLGPDGTTADEASALADLVQRRLHASGLPYRASMVDPAAVLDLPDEQLKHTALIRQRTISVSTDSPDGDIDVLSRWNPVQSPWGYITTAILTRKAPTRVRATVLPTELNISDRMQLEVMLQRAEALRQENESRPGHRFQAERAISTLVDLQQSFSTPVLCAEIAVLSSEALPELFLRDVGSSLTSETDVLRRGGHTVVAGQHLMLGGFDIERDPRQLGDAIRAGLPLRGGMGNRLMSDLITLTESPVGWPVPISGPIPTIPSGTIRELAVPMALAEGIDIGMGGGGRRVHLPHQALARHMFLTGATGTGKSTVLSACAVDDLRNGRAFVFVDPHGDIAPRLEAFADRLGVEVLSLDPSDANTEMLQLLPRLREDGLNYAECQRAARRVCDAIIASLPDKKWAGPRWYQLAIPVLMLAMAHGVTVRQAVEWVMDDKQLLEKVKHPALGPVDFGVLSGLTSSRMQDSVSTRDWTTSKFGPLMSVAVERIVASTGEGTSVVEILDRGLSVIVNLSALTSSESSLVGHLVLSAVLDAAMERPLGERTPLRAYVDEAHKFIVESMQRVQTEGRKFGVSLALATQSTRQLDPVLSDIATSAAVQVAFRQSPDSANTLSQLIGIPARELTDLPDLHAYVKVTGEATCSVRTDAYAECPPLREKRAPETQAVKLAAVADDMPTGPLPKIPPAAKPAKPSFLDEWLEKRRVADEDGSSAAKPTSLPADLAGSEATPQRETYPLIK